MAETICGTLLVLGLFTERVAAASGVLLALFGAAMATSHGVKSPLDYSVLSPSAAALLLTDRLHQRRRSAGSRA